MESRADMLNGRGKISAAPALTFLSALLLADWLAAVELLLGWLMLEAFLSSSDNKLVKICTWKLKMSMHPIPLPQKKVKEI